MEELLIEEAKRRAQIFGDLNKYLEIIVETVKKLDKEAEVYLFGSVAEGKHLLSSDIDILVITNTPPSKVLAELWNKDVKEPFEIHVTTKDKSEIYKRKAKLIKLSQTKAINPLEHNHKSHRANYKDEKRQEEKLKILVI